MPISQVVNLPLGSAFGFKRAKNPANPLQAGAPLPIQETIKEMDSLITIVGTRANRDSKIISVSTPDDFIFPAGQTSTNTLLALHPTYYNDYLKSWTGGYKKTITITNLGNADVVMFPNSPFRPLFSAPETPGVFPVLHSVGGTDTRFINGISSLNSYTLGVGQTTNVEIAYYGTDTGDFSSLVSIESNAGSGPVTVYTSQLVGVETYDFNLSTTTVVTTTVVLGRQEITNITITPIRNGFYDTEYSAPYTTSIVGNAGWSVRPGINEFALIFDPDLQQNTTGTYYSTVTVTSNNISHDIVNTAYINIDYRNYKTQAQWISAAAPYNAVIGISLDQELVVDSTGAANTSTVLTIALGTGGDGTPQYGYGGSVFAELRDLIYDAATIDQPYPYWANVYSFVLSNTATSYMSGALDENGNSLYQFKSTEGFNYSDYFGFEQSQGSIFLVEHDGGGNVTIEINNLRETSGNAEFDTTLQNITKAFYYYSNVENPPRYYQLEAPVVDGSLTHLFRGFISTYDQTTGKPTFSVDVTTVPLPTA